MENASKKQQEAEDDQQTLQVEVPEEGEKKTGDPGKRKLTLFSLVAITYFLTAGGPYGLENLVGTCPNPFWVLAIFVSFPLFYAVPLSMVCAELATMIPDNGGIMSWIKEAFGFLIGFIVGFCYVITYLLDISLYPVMFSAYLNEAIGYQLDPWISWAIGCGLVLFLTFINIIGVQLVGTVSFLFLIVVMSPFLVIPILGITYINPLIWVKGASTFPHDVNWGYMLSLLIWNNSGWMSPGFLAGETKNVKTTYPRAMLTSLVLANLTFVLPLAIGICVNRDWDSWEIGIFATIGEQVGGEWLKIWIIVASMFTNAGLFNCAMATSSRGIAAMAENGYFPKFFGWEAPWVKTPIVGIIIDCVVTMILIRLPFSTLIGAQACINSMTMILLYLSFLVLRFRQKDRKRPFKVPLNNYVCIIFVLPAIVISAYNMIFTEWTSQMAFGIALFLSIILFPFCCREEFKQMLYSVRNFITGLKGRISAWTQGRRFVATEREAGGEEAQQLDTHT